VWRYTHIHFPIAECVALYTHTLTTTEESEGLVNLTLRHIGEHDIIHVYHI